MCIRDRVSTPSGITISDFALTYVNKLFPSLVKIQLLSTLSVSYTHLRAHETVLDLVCRLLLEKKKKKNKYIIITIFISSNATHTATYIDSNYNEI